MVLKMLKLQKKLMLTLSFLELWERFGYYGMRALLALFLIKHFGFSDSKTMLIYSLYASICYIVPVIGGFLADKILGYKNLLFTGGVLICFGHIIMSFISSNEEMLYLGLAFIAIGTGFFKGNISNMLGTIYDKRRNKDRDSGFRIFYIMINLGSFVSSLICGIVAEVYGWSYGFGLAGLGMLTGLTTLLFSKRLLYNYGNPPKEKLYALNKLGSLGMNLVGYISGFILIAIVTMMFSYIEISLKIISVTGIFIFLHLVYMASNCTPKERLGILFIFIMMMFLMLMFALEMQLGSFINIFTDKYVDRTMFGIEIPASSLQALNPFTIIILGSLVTILLAKASSKYSLMIYGSGLLLSALCFMTLYLGCNLATDCKMPIIFLIIAMILLALSEVMMAPIIQSLITYVVPEKMRGYMMGILMLCLSYSNLAGVLIVKYIVDDTGEKITDAASLIIYQEAFFKIGILFIVATILYAISYKFLKKIYNSSIG